MSMTGHYKEEDSITAGFIYVTVNTGLSLYREQMEIYCTPDGLPATWGGDVWAFQWLFDVSKHAMG